MNLRHDGDNAAIELLSMNNNVDALQVPRTIDHVGMATTMHDAAILLPLGVGARSATTEDTELLWSNSFFNLVKLYDHCICHSMLPINSSLELETEHEQ